MRVAGVASAARYMNAPEAAPRDAASGGGEAAGLGCGFDPERYTFAACLLRVADPSVPLLSPDDRTRCLEAFVNRAEIAISRDAAGIAAAFSSAHSGRRGAVGEALEPLRRAGRAVSDEGLADAFVLHMARMLRVCVAVRRGDAGVPCAVFPPDAAVQDPCVLVALGPDGAYGLVDVEHAARQQRLLDVQRHLAAELRPRLPDAHALARMARAELAELAASVAVPLYASLPPPSGPRAPTPEKKAKQKARAKPRAALAEEIGAARGQTQPARGVLELAFSA